MGLRSADGLRAFCEDLGSPDPSPGGGTAAAAAGAMAASLLSMVCGITLKSKRHEKDWPELATIKEETVALGVQLLNLARDDALAYDAVVGAARAKRASPQDERAEEAYGAAIRNAMEVPLSTARACTQVLSISERVASLGTKSAASDVEVARRLAAAGVDGAIANVMINLPHCTDAQFASEAEKEARHLAEEKASIMRA